LPRKVVEPSCAACAPQDAFIPQDRDSGRSRGFAFVTMSDANAAQEAISKLHETDFHVRDLAAAAVPLWF
jgi:hypothetical protein